MKVTKEILGYSIDIEVFYEEDLEHGLIDSIGIIDENDGEVYFPVVMIEEIYQAMLAVTEKHKAGS